MTPRILLTVTEAAEAMGRSRSWLDKKLRAYEIGFIPQGRKGKLVPVAEIHKFVQSNTVHSPEQLRAALDGRRK